MQYTKHISFLCTVIAGNVSIHTYVHNSSNTGPPNLVSNKLDIAHVVFNQQNSKLTIPNPHVLAGNEFDKYHRTSCQRSYISLS